MKPGKTVLITKVGDKIMIMPKPEDPIKGLVKAGEQIGMKNIRRHIKEE